MKPLAPAGLPRGLPGAIARIAERVSNQTDVRDLDFHSAADGMFLADLHCDTLLWGVDPMASRNGGHVDGPTSGPGGHGAAGVCRPYLDAVAVSQ